MTQPTPPPAATRRASRTDALVNQLSVGPTLAEVAAVLLRDDLNKSYPALSLDPNTAMVGEPAWDLIDDEIISLPPRYQSLTELLTGIAVRQETIVFEEGVQFLTRLPLTAPVVHLPVQIERIGRLLNELSKVLNVAFQEQLLAFWSATGTSLERWRELSQTLQSAWDADEDSGWNEQERAMARQLFRNPEQKRSNPDDKVGLRACLIDVDHVDGTIVKHLNETSTVVLIGKVDDSEVILAYSLLNGYEKFSSEDCLDKAIPNHLNPSSKLQTIEWRLYEPDGNIFDHQACSLIAMQVDAIGAMDLSTLNAPEQALNNMPGTGALTAGAAPGQSWFQQAMPQWLKTASTADQTLYARYLKDLSALTSAHAGKTGLEGIVPIADYTLTALRNQMLQEHPEAADLDLEHIRIQIKTPVVWGLFVVPGDMDIRTFSLVELALQNLIALPPGLRTVQSHNPLPEWLTLDYIENLISTLDIGRTYPEMIKSTLIDDSVESARRCLLYSTQLRLQLPLLALQYQLEGQHGIDESGYRYVAALMALDAKDRVVDANPVVMRKLAFVPQYQLTSTADVVSNMYVIGPENPAAGPCLLYRPMSDQPLSQYSSPDHLLYAIRQTPALRASVLAWMADGVRENYARHTFPGVVPSPWAAVDYLADPANALKLSGPIALSREAMGGDLLAALFKANADALVTLADRQSVSNSESRWATFKHAGWLMFNAALPFMGRTVGVAMWLWQIMDDLEQLAQDRQGSDSDAKWSAFVDLLLNLAMAVSAHAISRRQRSGLPSPSGEGETHVPSTPVKLVIKKRPPLTAQDRAPDQHQPMHTTAALAHRRQSLGELLATLSVDKPKSLEKPHTVGPRRGLYRQGAQWYAQIADEWFQVSVSEDDVFIYDARKSASTGLPLIASAAGAWYVDLRLRLRGGGLGSSRRKVQSESDSSSESLRAELIAFELRKAEKQKVLQTDHTDMAQTAGTSRQAKQKLFLQTLNSQRNSYDEALQRLIEWSKVGEVPDFGSCRLGYIKAQMDFTLAELDEMIPSFTPVLNKSLEYIDQPVDAVEQSHIDNAQELITSGDEMIERLDYMHARFTELKSLGPEGMEMVRETRGKLPVYDSDTVRLAQLDMYRHLCLTRDSTRTSPEGWARLNKLIDIAAVSFQSLREAIEERREIRLDEQIEALSSLIDQFTLMDERLADFHREYQSQVRADQLARLRSRIGEFKKRTVAHLKTQVAERDALRLKNRPYEPRPLPQRKIIRAHYWGVVSGEPRLSASGEETGLVDLKRPYSDKPIVTFHHKSNGMWAPVVKPGVFSSTVPPLASSMTTGRALIDGLARFNDQVNDLLKNTDRTPFGIELLMREHAERLTHVSGAITKASTHLATTTDLGGQAAALSLELNSAAKTLHQFATDTLLGMIKQRPPTVENVEWLKARNHISIKRTVRRRKVKGADNDLFDRYEITDVSSKKKVLWYADFHYPTDWRPDHAYLSARLRTPEQVASGDRVDEPPALNEQQLIDYYRSEISVDRARELFFPPRPK